MVLASPASPQLWCASQTDVDENEEADKENAEGKLRFSGGRGEAATYDDGDEEDRQMAAKPSAEDLEDDDDGDTDQVCHFSPPPPLPVTT